MPKNNVRPSLEGLYSIPETAPQGTTSGAATRDDSEGLVRGSTPAEVQDFYRRKAQFYRFLPWAVGTFVAAILVLYAVYLQNVLGPLNQLQVKTDINTTNIEKLQSGLDNLKDAVVNLQKK